MVWWAWGPLSFMVVGLVSLVVVEAWKALARGVVSVCSWLPARVPGADRAREWALSLGGWLVDRPVFCRSVRVVAPLVEAFAEGVAAGMAFLAAGGSLVVACFLRMEEAWLRVGRMAAKVRTACAPRRRVLDEEEGGGAGPGPAAVGPAAVTATGSAVGAEGSLRRRTPPDHPAPPPPNLE